MDHVCACGGLITETAGAIRQLRVFNEKAEKLEGVSFSKSLVSHKTGVTLSWNQGSPLAMERSGPDDEAIDEFVLTLRFFVQDNESTSLRNVAGLYSGLSVENGLTESFNSARDALNTFLDSKAILTINEWRLTYRDIFEVFMWSGLAHANEQKKEIFDSWRHNSLLFPMLQNEFVVAISAILQAVFYVARLNRQVLDKLMAD